MLITFLYEDGLYGKSRIVFYNSALLCTVPECAVQRNASSRKGKVLILDLEFLYSVDH